jgi:hypothetical protein
MSDQLTNRRPVGLPWSEDDLKQMTTRFVAAMAAAIRAGHERPPQVGVDRTPGTKKPRRVPAALGQAQTTRGFV